MGKFCFCLLVGALLSAGSARAQTIAQVTEQLILDIQKLSELKKILQDMYQSYQIIDKGYTDIRDIVQGNFDLHKAFLDVLLVVSPAVRNYPRVGDIINTEAALVTEYRAAFSRFSADGHFNAVELGYIGSVYAVLFQRSLKNLDELLMVTTDDQLRMSDAERLAAIDRIYENSVGDLNLLRSFNNGTSVQAVQRAKEANDIGTLRSIYGITK